MGINLQLPKLTELKPRIVVIGVGGAGGNAINNMITSGLSGVEYIAANTDAQALIQSSAERRIQLGANLTEGLGAGSKPEIGQAAAEEAIEEIKGQIAGAHMVFVAAGMGGGTGTGAASVIARASRELGILTVGIVTKPFQFEGTRRMRTAEIGIAELRKYVDTLIVIPNQNLFRVATDRTTFADAFVLADQVLYSGVACIVDLIVKDGLINLDFADVRTIMGGMGTAMMGTGEATGDRRAYRAAEEAISNPLLDEISLKGAKGVLLSIIGGQDMTLFEVDEAASRVRQEVDPEANIIVGATFDEQMGEKIRVAIVASGLNGAAQIPGGAPLPFAATSMPHPAQQSAPVSPSMPPPFSPRPEVPALRASAAAAAPPPLPRQRRPGDSQDVAPAHVENPRELWRAPGNVVIEEARPVRAGSPAPERASTPATGRIADPFHPAPPDESSRSAPRRLHGIDEFPPVGQRDFHAKSGRYDVPANPHPAQSERIGDSRGRAGLLQRVMGNATRDASSPPENDPGEARGKASRFQSFFNRSKG